MTRLEKTKRSLVRSWAVLALVLASSLPAGACFEEPQPECAFACPQDETCPQDYRCTKDGWCKRNDIAFGYVCSPASLVDAATFDSARPDADTTDADTTDATP